MSTIPRAWDFNIDFIGRMNPILWFSAITSLASLVCLATVGLNFGTDFAGGYEIQLQFPQAFSETQIRDVLAPVDMEDAQVQRFGDLSDNSYLVLVRGSGTSLTPAIKEALHQAMASLAKDQSGLTGFALAENGEALTVAFAHRVDPAAVQKAVEANGLRVARVVNTEAGADAKGQPQAGPAETSAAAREGVEYRVELASLADKVANALRTGLHLEGKAAEADSLIRRVDFVGPQVGAQLRNQGIMAVVYSLLFILLYVALRFDLFFSPGAVVATLHDVVLVMGVFSAFQIEFNLTVVAALLTLIGYSLNDTIVVYDRIRENVARQRGRELRTLVNDSINETLSRTILTSGTVFMVVSALLALGGPFIRGFAITMFVGVIVGAYSSIAVASPLYILLRERGNVRAPAGQKVVKA